MGSVGWRSLGRRGGENEDSVVRLVRRHHLRWLRDILGECEICITKANPDRGVHTLTLSS
jgi:hypothetical protein